MSQLLSTSIRRLLALQTALGVGACILVLVCQPAGAASLREDPLVPEIINGQEASISQYPWQVFVMTLVEEGQATLELNCGGSILDSTHILTAAHCIDHEGSTTTYPAEDIRVLAGASDVASFKLPNLSVPLGAQERRVVRARVHPYYSPLPNIKDDAAVLELASPLELSAQANAQAIPLVAPGATPAAGTPLSLSGYGKENGAENVDSNGKLYSTSLIAISADACRDLAGANSAVLMCAYGANSAGCQGDSGGPLTEGSPAVEVGMVDFGEKGCPTGRPAGFTNLAAPEVRDFIEGSESPPIAPRASSPPVLRSVGSTPVDYSPLTCEPGAWSGSPSFTYGFQVENSSAQVLQSGPAAVFAPPASAIGASLVCVVQASNPGGVATARSGSTQAIASDSAAPVSSISGLSCRLRSCTLSISAADPNALALGVESWVSYEVSAKCPAKGARKGRSARRRVCHWTNSAILPVRNPAGGVYHATATGLPYDKSVTFTAMVTNAAGLRPARPAVRFVTLHPPKKSKRVARHTRRPSPGSRHARRRP